MKLPPDVVIAPEKLTRYLLVRQSRSDKSAYLALAGYELNTADRLLADLRKLAAEGDALPLESNLFGRYYEIRTSHRAQRPRDSRLHNLDDGALVPSYEIHHPRSRSSRTMTFELYSDAALARDLPNDRLRRGDLVRLVEKHVAPDGTEGFSAEVLGAKGQTLAVVTVPADALEALRDDEVLSVRAIAV